MEGVTLLENVRNCFKILIGKPERGRKKEENAGRRI